MAENPLRLHADNEDTIKVGEVVLGLGIEGGRPTCDLALGISLCAFALALAGARFIHANSRISRLVYPAA